MFRYNLFFKVVAFVMVITCGFGFVGCSNVGTDSKPTDPNALVDPTNPGQTQDPTQDPAIVAAEQQAQMYEAIIAKMDPYVTTNNDETYTLDYQSFLNAEGKNLTADEQKAAEGFSNGILIVNAQILQEQKESGSTALGSACWRYWWGVRCCYWGTTASQIANGFQIGTITALWFPIVGIVSGFTGAVLQLYVNAYGGFCVNAPWGFPVVPPWLSRP